MTHNLRQLHEELLHQVALEKGRWRNSSLTAFAALKGDRDSGNLMVVGRAVNGWTSKWRAEDAADIDTRARIVEEAFSPTGWNDGRPMLWVSNCWGATSGYNTKKSAFWRVIRATVGMLGLADHVAILHFLEQPVQSIPCRGRKPAVDTRGGSTGKVH